MRLNRLTKIWNASLLLTPMLFTSAVAQQPPPTRVAVIDFQDALMRTAEMQTKSKQVEDKYKPRQEELVRLAKELQELQQKLQNASGAEAGSLRSQIQRKQREAQRKQEDLQSDFDFDRNEILQGGARTMREVIAKLAEEKGLDVVVDISNTLFFKPVLDITSAATAAYNEKQQAQ